MRNSWSSTPETGNESINNNDTGNFDIAANDNVGGNVGGNGTDN